ncbi:unnamed protein product [Adineta ricciae]|uniref:Uncharacterized protein n=1 Tax=Adineta ricciae TaxID=249248 RepID=A0A814Q7G0_ADIRI|nr:unnamed protein product [Adineta ricciae]CAF1115416.1 unnamed protein product [Adineta ricciae]
MSATQSVSPIALPVLFTTYFLTVQTIEFSLSSYVLNENDPELYRKYLLFKSNAFIWKWWHLFTLLTIPLSIFEAIRDLLRIFTANYPVKRHLMSIVRAMHLFTTLYISFTCALPLETKLSGKSSRNLVAELNYYQLFLFLLNIIGWFIPLIQYKQAQSIKPIPVDKKDQ